MITRYEHNGITWVDMESPSRQELQDVVAEFGVDARIEAEIISPTPYPLVVEAADYLYLILHFPTTDPRGGAKSQEIDFIVGPDFLITSRYEVIGTIHSLHKIFESEELLGIGSKRKANSGDLVARILRQMYAAISEEAEQFSRMLERVEEDIFSDEQKRAVLNISLVGRVLLRFDTVLARHKEPLTAFLTQLCAPQFFGKGFADSMTQIEAEHDHAASIVASYRAVAAELRNTNDSLLSTSQNEIIQRLTTITFVAIPLTVIAGIFGMNTHTMPFVDSPYGFWYIIGIMVVMIVVFLSYFKYKKWL